jgi:hypothetical protein
MKYCVNVPVERELQFPNRCPFSDKMSPTGTVRLKRTSTSLVIPLPGGFLNSYSTTAMRLPADKAVAALAIVLESMIWVSILGGMAVDALLLATTGVGQVRYTGLFTVGGLLAALVFRIARWFVLRSVRIGKPWNGFIEMRFASEAYAKEFSELNRLALVT